MRRSLRSLVVALALLALLAPTLRAHDLFLKLANYFITPGTAVSVRVLNGTFSTSENYVTRDRLQDIALVGGGTRQRIDTSKWSPSADNKSGRMRVDVGAAGTYVLGASTLPRVLSLPGKDFNTYLSDEGLGDVVEARKRAGIASDSSHERYSKHVKAIFQVGATRSNDFSRVLGYPAEIVPVNNPYDLTVGGELKVRCLLNGEPAPRVTVLAGGRTENGARLPAQSVRADDSGTAMIRITRAGIWYVKFISMEPRSEQSVNYESRWATLTFGVRK